MKLKSTVDRKFILVLVLALLSLNTCFEANRSKASKKTSLKKVSSKTVYEVEIQETPSLSKETHTYKGQIAINAVKSGIDYFNAENAQKTFLLINVRGIDLDETSNEKKIVKISTVFEQHLTATFTDNIKDFNSFKEQLFGAIAHDTKYYLSEVEKTNLIIANTEELLPSLIKQRDLLREKFNNQILDAIKNLRKREIDGKFKYVDESKIKELSNNILYLQKNQLTNQTKIENCNRYLFRFKNLFRNLKDNENLEKNFSENPTNEKLIEFLKSSRLN